MRYRLGCMRYEGWSHRDDLGVLATQRIQLHADALRRQYNRDLPSTTLLQGVHDLLVRALNHLTKGGPLLLY